MAKFRYRALNHDGTFVTGKVEAVDKFGAIQKVRDQYDIIDTVEEIKTLVLPEILTRAKFKDKVIAVLCSQFAIILAAGLPIARCVRLIVGQTTDRHMKKILNEVADDVASGRSLADSFAQRGKGLPVTFIETIKAGEESGTLERSFQKLQRYYEKSAKIKGKVSAAMIYPIFVLVVAMVVIVVIVFYAVPTFEKMFSSMGEDLPIPTKMLIGIYNFGMNYGFLVVIIIVVLIIAWMVLTRVNQPFKMFVARFVLKIPVIGKIVLLNNCSQLANTMTTLVAAGLPLTACMKLVGKMMGNAYMGKSVENAIPGVESGRRMADCLRENTSFPNLLLEMITVGEEAGSIEDTMETTGDFYDSEVEQTTTKAMALLEPLTILLLAFIVGFLLLAVYLPIFSMYAGM